MNTLMEINPLRFFDELFNSNSGFRSMMASHASRRFPPVNVFLDDNAVVVDVELPGKTASDVELTLEPQAVTIADKPAAAAPDAATAPSPAWSRRLELPFHIDADKANAKFTNGILRVELPKAEKTGARRIAIAG